MFWTALFGLVSAVVMAAPRLSYVRHIRKVEQNRVDFGYFLASNDVPDERVDQIARLGLFGPPVPLKLPQPAVEEPMLKRLLSVAKGG